MLITDKKQLEKYSTPHRLWQGISSIEVTKKGRVFVTFYSGEKGEQIGNYSMLIKSDDGCKTFSEPIAVAEYEAHRCYDPCLWIDPLGRLWFTWGIIPDHAVYAAICDDPDAEELVWHKPKIIGNDVMMNKPIVLSTGEWLFPIAVWSHGVRALPDKKYDTTDKEYGAFVYKSSDNGETFTKLGGTLMPDSSFDEHMVIELENGNLMMLVRTNYGIGVSYSIDGGKSWSEGERSGIPGPCSRFHIRRLKSGRILLVNHLNFYWRNNMAALLSDDDGKTWKYSLMLDTRNDVSYPDAAEGEDGYIYITYDCQRGGFKNSLEELYECDREILVAKITEEDIMAGKIVNKGSRLKIVASKLGKYGDEENNPYDELRLLSEKDFIDKIIEDNAKEDIVPEILEQYPINCINLHKFDYDKFDGLVEKFENTKRISRPTLTKILRLVRSASGADTQENPIVEKIKEMVNADLSTELSVSEIAKEIGISLYYMCHLFKRKTSVSISDYRNSCRLKKAKSALIDSDMSISEIASMCGYNNSSYFTECFTASEGIPPTEYRKIH